MRSDEWPIIEKKITSFHLLLETVPGKAPVGRKAPAAVARGEDVDEIAGKALYMSPEQCRGKGIEARSDQFSLGLCLYHMLTGRFPYEVVGNIRDVMDRIMNSEPARPSTIRRQSQSPRPLPPSCLRVDQPGTKSDSSRPSSTPGPSSETANQAPAPWGPLSTRTLPPPSPRASHRWSFSPSP